MTITSWGMVNQGNACPIQKQIKKTGEALTIATINPGNVSPRKICLSISQDAIALDTPHANAKLTIMATPGTKYICSKPNKTVGINAIQVA